MSELMEKIKTLREETGLSVIECKKALVEAEGNVVKAKEILSQRGLSFAAKKGEREVKDGIVYAYIHNTKKIGVLLELSCETDFVARNEEFGKLAHEISLQIASTNPANIEELLEQPNIRDASKTISDLITAVVAKVGEKITITRFTRYVVGESLVC